MFAILLPGLQQLTGINAVSMYTTIIFDDQPNSDYLATLLSAVQIVFSILALFVVNKFDRRTLFLAGSVICSIGHFICCVSLDDSGECTARNWSFNSGAFLFAGVYNTTYGSITYSSYLII